MVKTLDFLVLRIPKLEGKKEKEKEERDKKKENEKGRKNNT